MLFKRTLQEAWLLWNYLRKWWSIDMYILISSEALTSANYDKQTSFRKFVCFVFIFCCCRYSVLPSYIFLFALYRCLFCTPCSFYLFSSSFYLFSNANRTSALLHDAAYFFMFAKSKTKRTNKDLTDWHKTIAQPRKMYNSCWILQLLYLVVSESLQYA